MSSIKALRKSAFQYSNAGTLQVVSTVTYTYDAAGNRVSVEREGLGAFIEPYSPNPLNQYEQVGESTYEYDADGNLIKQTEDGIDTNYSYDIEGRLVE